MGVALPVLLVGGMLGVAAAPAAAAAIVVTTTADAVSPGECTLRQAITSANTDTAQGSCGAGSGADTILFDEGVTGVLQLASTLPAVETAMTITGPGADILTVRGDLGATTSVVRNLLVTATGSLTLSGLTIDQVQGDYGGAIGNHGTLSLVGVSLLDNEGAGFTVNSFGGGVASDGTLTVRNSTVAGNDASAGGGIANNGGTLTVVNSTIWGNEGFLGGGVYNAGTATFLHVTLAGNVAVNGGGFFADPGSSATLRSSIVASNTVNATIGSNPNCSSGPADAGYNLSFEGGCGFSAANNSLTEVDPLLAELALGEGTTATMVPQSGSAVINAIPLDGTGQCVDEVVTADQRGVARPQGEGCDIGAVEVAVEAPTDSTAPSITVTSPVDLAVYLRGVALLASYTCTDDADGSGLATCLGTVPSGQQVDTQTLGARTFTVSATDVAGNEASAEVEYTVVASADTILGFGPPVSSSGVTTAKAGRVLPLKFSVRTATGTPVLLDSSQVTVIVHRCGTTPQSYPVAAVTSGTSGFQVLGAGAYQLNIVTQKNWARTCRTLGVDLGGGAVLTANFAFTS